MQHLDKKRIASCFEASGATYEKSALVQKEISIQLIDFLGRVENVHYSNVLEIGCCTGILTEHLCDFVSIDTLYLNDLVPSFCVETKKRVEHKTGSLKIIPGDIEEAVLPAKLDLVISSSTFQWMEHLPILLQKIRKNLKAGGHLAFSIFGPGTMSEISQLTGNCLFYHTNEALVAMVENEFTPVLNHTAEKRVYFPSVKGVLRHIQETGVGGLSRQKWTREKLRLFEEQYTSNFSSKKGIPVSYVSSFIIAEKKR